MKRQQYEKIIKQIDINKTHIENFVLESSTGTKRMQSKFHKNAIIERNNFVNKELKLFQKYQEDIYNELLKLKNNLLPADNKDTFNKEKIKQETTKKLLLLINDNIPVIMKLGITKMLEPFEDPDDSSLVLINNSIKQIISKLQEASINITKDDFNYSMFTTVYMDAFFSNIKANDFNQIMQKNFENIYWECPELVIHLKLALYNILTKYSKQLLKYTESLRESLLKKENVSSSNVYKVYSEKKISLDNKIKTDAYLNLDRFLNKTVSITDYLNNSPQQEKSFNQFAKSNNYTLLDDQDKKSFIRETFNLYNTLQELKNYYLFEPIIKKTKTLYEKKEETKTSYLEKQKEINKEENIRLKLYKDYNKSLTKGLFSKPNPEKARLLKLQMNEQITKLNILYDELHNFEINNHLSKLTDASTIFEVLRVSLNSYYYLKKVLIESFSENDNFSLEKYLDKYFDFIYNPTNIFIRKINALTDYDIADVISEKYRLSGLNISKDLINQDSLDQTTETIKYITTVNYLKQCKLSIKDMYFIYNITQLELSKKEKI